MSELQKIDKYLLLEEQESTVIGTAWRAGDVQNGKLAAHYLADVLENEIASDAQFVSLYRTQTQFSVKLDHPNILAKVDTVEEQGQLVAIYPYQEGFSLAKVLDRCQNEGFPFSIDHALLVAGKLLAALTYAKNLKLNHGYINPAMILITHEGEVQLKGFALSTAMRAAGGSYPNLLGYHNHYLAPNANLQTDRDRLDIYGVGAILFEMLTGQNFNQLSGAPADKITNAVMEVDGEQIPTQIANILISALDPTAPTAYQDVAKMSADMEQLLYSGEYSPTTFNLAFFMHSAFREEMEALSASVAAERERTFAAAAAAPVAAMSEPPPRQEPQVQAPSPRVTAEPPAKKKSPMPIIIGAVAAVAVIAVILFVILGRGDGEEDSFERQKAQLEQQAALQEADILRKQQEDLANQNELLREQLREQARLDNERRKAELNAEMQRMDDEIRDLQQQKEEERKRQELQDRIADLEEQREKLRIEEEERLERERQREAEEALAAQMKEEETAGQDANLAESTEGETAVADNASTDAAPNESTEVADAAPETAVDPGPDDTTGSMPVRPPEQEVRPPAPGSIIPLDDPLLVYPQLMEQYASVQEAPRRAVKAGLVERDRTISYLMRVLVNEKGRVEDVMLHKSPIPPGEDDFGMMDNAERTVSRLKFSPPSKLGAPVKVWMIVSVHYRGK